MMVMIYIQIAVLESSMLMPSFFEIGKPVPEKKIFEGFYHYMGMAAILVT